MSSTDIGVNAASDNIPISSPTLLNTGSLEQVELLVPTTNINTNSETNNELRETKNGDGGGSNSFDGNPLDGTASPGGTKDGDRSNSIADDDTSSKEEKLLPTTPTLVGGGSEGQETIEETSPNSSFLPKPLPPSNIRVDKDFLDKQNEALNINIPLIRNSPQQHSESSDTDNKEEKKKIYKMKICNLKVLMLTNHDSGNLKVFKIKEKSIPNNKTDPSIGVEDGKTSETAPIPTSSKPKQRRFNPSKKAKVGDTSDSERVMLKLVTYLINRLIVNVLQQQ